MGALYFRVAVELRKIALKTVGPQHKCGPQIARADPYACLVKGIQLIEDVLARLDRIRIALYEKTVAAGRYPDIQRLLDVVRVLLPDTEDLVEKVGGKWKTRGVLGLDWGAAH